MNPSGVFSIDVGSALPIINFSVNKGHVFYTTKICPDLRNCFAIIYEHSVFSFSFQTCCALFFAFISEWHCMVAIAFLKVFGASSIIVLGSLGYCFANKCNKGLGQTSIAYWTLRFLGTATHFLHSKFGMGKVFLNKV